MSNSKTGAGIPERKRDNRPAREERRAGDEEQAESDGFQEESSVNEQDSTDEFKLPRGNTADKFYVKLKRKLASIGVRYERLTKKTAEGETPPCFEMVGADYDSWLAAASLTTDIPYRYDLPGEVNYCRDCTAPFRERAITAGKCLFPNTRFEVAKSNGETELVGVSRSPQVAPDGYRVYRGLLVDEGAVDE